MASSSTSAKTGSSFRTAVSVATLAVTGTALTLYYLDSRSAIHMYGIMPIARSVMDAETGHKFAVKALASGFSPRDMGTDDKSLAVELWGHRLSNPVGLAAGFDKDGEAIDGLFKLGFSWVEIGSVTPKPQEGNPKPRVFRLTEDQAIINRYGFPSQGHAVVLSRLRSYLATHPPTSSSQNILAINLGKNKSSAPDSTTDFLTGVAKFGPLVDVLVINVSSPNTPGLRGMQGRGLLEELLSEVVKARDALPARSKEEWKWGKAKVVVKIAPDLSEKEIGDIAEAVKSSGVDGVIVSNTTIQRPSEVKSINAVETGGLSGPPLHDLSVRALRTLRTQLPASVPIIGCGGISTASDAIDFASAGATLVQLYTSFAYGGVGVPRRVKDDIASALSSKSTTWAKLVETSVEVLAPKPPKPEDMEKIFNKQAADLKAALDGAGRRVAMGEELVLLKEEEPTNSGSEKSTPPEPTQSSEEKEQKPTNPAPALKETVEKSVADLIKEAEAALGISPSPAQ